MHGARSVEADGARQHSETGDERVDQVIAGLDRLGGLPLDEHVAVFEEAHATAAAGAHRARFRAGGRGRPLTGDAVSHVQPDPA